MDGMSLMEAESYCNDARSEYIIYGVCPCGNCHYSLEEGDGEEEGEESESDQ